MSYRAPLKTRLDLTRILRNRGARRGLVGTYNFIAIRRAA